MKIKFRNIKLLTTLILSAFCLFYSDAQQLSKVDSLLVKLDKSRSAEEKMNLYIEIANSPAEMAFAEREQYFENAFIQAKKTKDDYNIANTLCFMGIFYGRNRVLPSAIEKLKEAYLIALDNDYHNILLKTNYNIAVFYNVWQQYDISKKYLNNLYTICDTTKDLTYLAQYYNFMAQLYSINGQTDSSVYCLNQFLKYSLKYQDSVKVYIPYYNNMANIYLGAKNVDLAIYYIEKCTQHFTDSSAESGIINIYLSIAEIYITNDQLEDAALYLNRARSRAEKLDAYEELIIANSLASKLHKKTQQYDSALYYNELYMTMKDSIYGEKQMRLISDVQNQIESKYQQKEIMELKQKSLVTKILLFSSFIILLLLIAALFLTYSRTRLKTSLAHEQALALSDKLSYQKRELTNNALFITHQNNTYKTIMEELKKLSSIDNKEVKKDVNKIIQRILLDRDKLEQKEFELKFKKVYEGYYKNLNTHFPKLTKKDLDFCTYLRVDMTTKEIASLTGSTIRSVEMARSRLRKKLNIDSDTNITDFLSKF